MVRCPNCNEENPDRFRVCGYCGTQLVGALAPAELRKTVTILFSDLKGSTNLGERLDPESLREVLNRYFAEMKQIIERHGGTIEKYIGDAIMAVFGIPRSHEDDALRAVRAAWETRHALMELNQELERRWGVTLANRTGVNTGQVVTGDATSGQRLVTGDTVNVAARLEQAAPELEVLIGEATWRLTRDAIEVEAVEPLELKGKSDRVPAYRLTGIQAGKAEGFARRLDAPMVGRSEELAELDSALRCATDERRCRIVSVLGQAGLGKTRLVEEFLARTAREARILRGRCLPYGEGITFWPLAEIVREAAGIGEDDPLEVARAKLAALIPEQPEVAARLSAVTGLSHEAFGIRETFWAARKLAEHLSHERPLILRFEDIHWAEPTFLDLVEHVVESAEGSSLLIVCTARPEFLEERPHWMEGRPNAVRIALHPLTDEETGRVADTLLGRTDLPPRVRATIADAAEGNPLFVEQTISMLVDEKALRPDGSGGWTLVAEPTSIHVPPTISALLSARLDRLGQEDRAVIEAGSIPGPVFHQGAVAHLSQEALRPQVPARLTSLTEKLLISHVPPTLVEDNAFRFQHILIRESAYDALLKRARADMHERYVDWLEGAVGPSAMDVEEIVGFHLEQAYRYLVELAPVDDRARKLGRKASAQLAIAGRRGLARGDLPAATNLLQRALALVDERSEEWLDLALDLADALKDMGQFARADELLAKATETATARGDVRRTMALGLGRLMIQRSTGTDWAESALRWANEAIPVFEAAGDHAALAQASRLLAAVHGYSNRYEAAGDASARSVEEARIAGDRRLETRGMMGVAIASLMGPRAVPDAIALCEKLLVQASGDQRAQSVVRAILAQLNAMRGRFKEARELYAGARSTLVDLGVTLQAASIANYAARVELLAEQPDRAETILRPSYETLRTLGEKNFITTIAAILAEAILDQGRDAEADELASFTERTAKAEDVDAQFRWRLVRAKLLARASRYDEAVEVAREAVDLRRRSDSPAQLAGTLLVLTHVLHLAGRTDEAVAAAREALALFETKGDVVSTEKSRAILAGLDARALAARDSVVTR